MAAVSQRVLVSRQLEDAEPLTQALVRGGYEPLVIPAIQIVLRGVPGDSSGAAERGRSRAPEPLSG